MAATTVVHVSVSVGWVDPLSIADISHNRHNWWWRTFLSHTGLLLKSIFWPVLAEFAYFVTNLRIFCVVFTGGGVMYQNWQISGTPLSIFYSGLGS